MKKIIALLMALVVAVSFTSAVSGDEETITVTMTPSATANISVNVSDISVTGLEKVETTSNVALNNTGNVSVNVTIGATDTTNWTLTDGDVSNAANEFNLTYDKEGSGDIAITTGTSDFETYFAYSGTKLFDITVRTPKYTDSDADQVSTITFTATAC
jgi:maltose-binding protein MalE